MWIRYFVPEDGDDASHPNVYQTDKANTLEDVKRSFPLSGNFHFRFLKEIEKMSVWLDITDNSTPLPTHQGGLFIKASRLKGSSPSLERKSTERPAAVESTAPGPSLNRSTSSSSSVPAPAPAPTTRQPSEKLLNFDHHDEDFGSGKLKFLLTSLDIFVMFSRCLAAPASTSPIPPAPVPAPAAAEPFFDDHVDLLGMSAPSSTSQSQKV